MYEFFASLRWEGWVAVLTLAGAALWKPAEALVGWLRAAQQNSASMAEVDSERDGRLIAQLLGRSREDDAIKEALRRALDKSLVRENGLVTAGELLLAIIEQIEEPSETQRLMRNRAIEILELARRRSNGQLEERR